MIGAVDDGFDRVRAALAWWADRPQPPTSSLTGGGAIAELEATVGHSLGGHALALPSGSAAIMTGLRSLGVHPGDGVLVDQPDWYGAVALVRAIGATPLAVDAAGAPAAVLAGRKGNRRPVGAPILLDLGGIGPGEITGVRRAEWDAVAISLGPGKQIDAGEGGLLVMRSTETWRRAAVLTQHPIRLRLHGLGSTPPMVSERIHPVAALVALHQLSEGVPSPAVRPVVTPPVKEAG